MPCDTPAEPTPKSARTSALLLDFAQQLPDERVSLGDLRQVLGARSFGFLLLLLALPNAVPVGIPGSSMITGIPLALVALQMMLGRAHPYLPRWLANRSMHRDSFRLVVNKSAPWLERVERLMRPRWRLLTGRGGERFLGAVCFVLALFQCLPIPLGNLLPAAGVAILALGAMERDGMTVGLGLVAGLTGAALASGVAWGMVKAGALVVAELLA